ncbi:MULTISPECIES: hypothetical protein [Cyanophyceae]|uniref:hypothetical protein n=1 Tax=Cyanophyceae TaxID=3028117 RepID=UPI0016885008|nr:hypothetical protein [Trichocoleus sp. FACHB-40]MBD2002006.1 hypothetical protein [Trichocoleus sp. FACHB-40]
MRRGIAIASFWQILKQLNVGAKTILNLGRQLNQSYQASPGKILAAASGSPSCLQQPRLLPAK